MPLVLLACTPAHFICETGWPNAGDQQKVTLRMGLIKKQNPVVQKAWYLLFLWRRRAEYDFTMSYFNWWFYRLMHRHEESFSYWNSLLFLKSSAFKDLVGKKIWNWYLPGTTSHYHCICMNEWQKTFYKSKWKAGQSFPMSYRHLHIHQVGLSRGGTGFASCSG